MKYEHIAWYRDEKTNSDKVWGIICLHDGSRAPSYEPNKYVSFWGRRGAKLQTKIFDGTSWDAYKMFEKKENKGYKSVELDELNEVYPEFQSDLEKTAFWATFKI